MKLLLTINLVFAMLFVICFWAFALFAHGAFIHPKGLVITGILGWFVLMPMSMGAPILFALNIYGIFKYWTKHKLMTLLPLLILVIAMMSLRILNVSAMSIKRFEKYLPDYESLVSKVEKEYKTNNQNVMRMPEEFKHLGYLAIVNDREPNNLQILIEVGSFGVFGHAYFVHSSNIINDDSKIFCSSRFKKVNDHWFRKSD